MKHTILTLLFLSSSALFGLDKDCGPGYEVMEDIAVELRRDLNQRYRNSWWACLESESLQQKRVCNQISSTVKDSYVYGYECHSKVRKGPGSLCTGTSNTIKGKREYRSQILAGQKIEDEPYKKLHVNKCFSVDHQPSDACHGQYPYQVGLVKEKKDQIGRTYLICLSNEVGVDVDDSSWTSKASWFWNKPVNPEDGQLKAITD